MKVGQQHQDRPDHRPGRLDRPLDRTASALRDAHRRRRRRPAEISARRLAARQRSLVSACSREDSDLIKIGRPAKAARVLSRFWDSPCSVSHTTPPSISAAQDVSLACLNHDSRHAQANRSCGSDRKKSDPHGAFLHRGSSSSIGLHGMLDGKPLITRQRFEVPGGIYLAREFRAGTSAWRLNAS